MLLLRLAPFLMPLFLVRAGGSRFDLSELLQKVIQESHLSAVSFIGIGDSFVTNFTRTHPDVAVSIFKAIPTDYNEAFFQKSAILVAQALDGGGHGTDELQTFIEHLRSRDFVVIVASELDSLYHSLSFWYENKFKRIFGSLNDSSYAYLPFADQPLQQLTRIAGEPLPHALKDLNGFALRTTVQNNYPRCFWYPDSRGQYQVGGYAGRALLEFFRRHNATFQEVLINNSREKNLVGIMNATLWNEIDISMTPYAPLGGLEFSHPLKVFGYRIMVPMLGYLDPDQSFSKPFTPGVWLCIGLALAYIVALDFVKDMCSDVTPSWWRSFRRTYLFMLLSSAGVATTSGYRFHGQVLLYVFVISNLYLVFCTSFLTAFIRVRGYDTIQDLVDNNVPVILPLVEWALMQQGGSGALDAVAVPVNFVTYSKAIHFITNTSLAYAVDEDFAHFLIHLRNPRQTLLLHILGEKLFTVFQAYLLPKHSLFRPSLNMMVQDVVARGLIKKWDHDVRVQATSAGFRIGELDELLPVLPVALRLGELLFAWMCLLGGLTLAAIAFLVECVGSRRVRAVCASVVRKL